MTNRIADTSLRKAAIVAGLGLLIMTIFAIFANFFVLENFIAPGDAAETTNNIMADEGLFRLGICSLVIVAILDVVVAWALYIFLKPVDKSLSLLAAWFRLVYATIFAAALNNLVNVLHLLSGADYLTTFEPNQLHAQIMLSLDAFSYGWAIAGIFFGLHLFVLGYLVFKSGYIPKIVGILVIIAGSGYLIDDFGKILLPNFDVTIAMFTFIGELIFMFWLLIQGVKVQRAQ